MGLQPEVEVEVETLVRAGALQQAATRVVDAYGSELFGFLVHLMGNDADAGDVFSQTVEDLWAALPKFEFRCSLRTWVYVLGRHAGSRFRRSPWADRERRGGSSEVQSLVQLARSRTQPWLRTEIKTGFAMIRESLSDEDRAILALRVDRDLPWEDIARVTLDEADGEPEQAAITREMARLRKRFQLLKEELRTRAIAAGLIEPPQA